MLALLVQKYQNTDADLASQHLFSSFDAEPQDSERERERATAPPPPSPSRRGSFTALAAHGSGGGGGAGGVRGGGGGGAAAARRGSGSSIGGARGGPSGRSTIIFTSVTTQFRNQLGALVKAIADTSPHFVRCINPNRYSVHLLYWYTSTNTDALVKAIADTWPHIVRCMNGNSRRSPKDFDTCSCLEQVCWCMLTYAGIC